MKFIFQQLIDKKYYFGYTIDMKTAISVPDNLFQQIEEVSKKMGISRSRLFSMAIQEFLQHYYAENVTIKLNEVYKKGEGNIENDIDKMQALTIQEESW